MTVAGGPAHPDAADVVGCEVVECLEAALGAPVTVSILKHKPGRRTTLSARGAAGSGVAKLYVSARAPVVAARLAALAKGPPQIVVPSLLAVDEALHLVLLSELSGEPLRQAVLAGDVGTCERAGAALAAWHEHWRGADPAALRPHTAGRELELLAGWTDRANPAVAARVQAATTGVADTTWPHPTVVHRDLYEEQILVGERIGLVDLDDAALGPPELDLGNVLAHLELLGRRAGRNLAAPVGALLAGYRREAAPLDEELLVRCTLLSRLRLACIHGDASLVDGSPAVPAPR